MSNNGKYGEKLFAERMRALGYSVEDVSGDSAHQGKDIDFIVTGASGAVKTFEVKWDERINQTGNFYLEIVNKNSAGALGWYKFCRADWVAYGDALAQCFYCVPLDALREAVARYNPRIAYCKDDSAGYLLPKSAVEKYIVII